MGMTISKGTALAFAIGAAAVAGITVGSLSATSQRTPEPTVAVAEIPTSTPDMRPTPTMRTLTPTQRPTSTPAPVAIATLQPAAASPIRTFPPTPTPVPRGRAVVYFASRQGVPVAVEEPKAAGGTSQSDHVFFRLAALRTTKAEAPSAYTNLFGTMKAAFVETTIDRAGTVIVGFIVGVDRGDWGVPADDVKLLLQQIVYTATEEPGVDRVLITQNGGKPAVIAGKTYDMPLSREDVR